MQFLPGVILALSFLEDAPQGAHKAVCILGFGVEFKEYVHLRFLEVGPVIAALEQRVAHMGQQVDSCLPVGQLLGLELLVLALGWPAKPFLVLAQFGLVFLCVRRAGFVLGFQPLLEVPLLFLGVRPRLALALEPHLLYPLARQLHDVEAVDDNLGIGEHGLDDAFHAVGEVHRHLLDHEPLLLRYHGEYPRHICHGRALDGRYECAVLAVAVPSLLERNVNRSLCSIVSSMLSLSPMFPSRSIHSPACAFWLQLPKSLRCSL